MACFNSCFYIPQDTFTIAVKDTALKLLNIDYASHSNKCKTTVNMQDWEKYINKIYYNPKHPASFTGVEKLYRAAQKDGRNISRPQIKQWLRSQETYTLHRRARRKFPRNKFVSNGIDDVHDADLMDMTGLSKVNDGFKYVLIIIDTFSRFLWAALLKNKTGDEVVQGFEDIYADGHKPNLLRTDKGKEFTNYKLQKYLKSLGVVHIVSNNEVKASFAESVIRTLKNKLYRYMTEHQSQRYIDVLEDMVDSYNGTYHSSIRRAPNTVSKDNEWEIFRLPYISKNKITKVKQPSYKFKIGDIIRLSYLSKKFDRGYDQKWTGELFRIINRYVRRGIPVYKVQDYAGESITGTFYEDEIQKVEVPPDHVYKIEKVLKTRKRKGETEHLVRWLNWPKKYDLWINAADIQNIGDPAVNTKKSIPQ